jgi:transcriptional regulator with XRE-family HTH domain
MARPPIRKPVTRSAVTYFRLRRRETLKQLAERVSEQEGVALSLPHLGAIELGKRGASPAIWTALAKALDVTVAQLRPPDVDDALQPSLFALDQYVEIVGDSHDPA